MEPRDTVGLRGWTYLCPGLLHRWQCLGLPSLPSSAYLWVLSPMGPLVQRLVIQQAFTGLLGASPAWARGLSISGCVCPRAGGPQGSVSPCPAQHRLSTHLPDGRMDEGPSHGGGGARRCGGPSPSWSLGPPCRCGGLHTLPREPGFLRWLQSVPAPSRVLHGGKGWFPGPGPGAGMSQGCCPLRVTVWAQTGWKFPGKRLLLSWSPRPWRARGGEGVS